MRILFKDSHLEVASWTLKFCTVCEKAAWMSETDISVFRQDLLLLGQVEAYTALNFVKQIGTPRVWIEVIGHYYLQAKQPKLDINPRPSCRSSLSWWFCGSSVPCLPPHQTMDTKPMLRREAEKQVKLVLMPMFLVCTGSECAANCQHSAWYPEEHVWRCPAGLSPPAGQEPSRILHHILKLRAHNHLSSLLLAQAHFLHLSTFSRQEGVRDRMGRLFRAALLAANYDSWQLRECNPGSAFLLDLNQFRSVSSR